MNEAIFYLDLIVEKETTETPFVLNFMGGNTDIAEGPPPAGATRRLVFGSCGDASPLLGGLVG
jgi:hypothetical protein